MRHSALAALTWVMVGRWPYSAAAFDLGELGEICSDLALCWFAVESLLGNTASVAGSKSSHCQLEACNYESRTDCNISYWVCASTRLGGTQVILVGSTRKPWVYNRECSSQRTATPLQTN